MRIIIYISIFLFNTLNAKTLDVSLSLSWKHQFQFAGYYIAKEKGFYKEVGLNVNIQEYDLSKDISKDVATQKIDFGIGHSTLILDKLNRYPNIIMLTAISQSSPLVLLGKKSPNIKTIEDIKNKRIMMGDSQTYTAPINAMLYAKNLTQNNYKIIPTSFNPIDIINGNADLMISYSSNEPFVLKEKGIETTIFDPKDYGFDFYSDILFTSNQMVQKNPKVVNAFYKATLKGWEYAYSHEVEAATIILNKYNTQKRSLKALLFEASILKKLAMKGDVKLGDINQHRLKEISTTYRLLGLIQDNNKIDFTSFIYNPLIKKNSIISKKEKKYLKEKQQINMCIDPNWMPFEKFDKNSNHIGMSADYFKIFQKQLNIPIKVIRTNTWAESLELAKDRKCDIVSLAMRTPKREEYLNFTSAYLKIPLVIATNNNVTFINDINTIKNKQVAIPKGYAFVEILRSKYPNLQIVEVKDIQEGLAKVTEGKIFGYVGSLASIVYEFQENFNSELKISGKFDEKWELGIAVRNDDITLLNILDKIVNSLDEKQQHQILNNWTSVKYENRIDYNLILQVLLVSVIIILIFMYWNRKLYLTKKELESSNIESKKYLEMIDNNVLVSLSNSKGIITDVSDALCKITGYKKNELIGKNHNIFRHQDMDKSAFKYMWETLLNGNSWQGEVKNLNKDGSYYWADVIISPTYDEKNKHTGYSAIRQNITDKKKLEEISITDTLTKIFNRLYLDRNYEYESKRAKRYRKNLSIILIDIDLFKSINDTFGHSIGDEVLIEISMILKQNLRVIDKLGRWGGEEFLIICPETNVENTEILAENLRSIIEKHLFSSVGKVTCSFGVTKYYSDDKKDEAFIRADKALYSAKEQGRNKVIVNY